MTTTLTAPAADTHSAAAEPDFGLVDEAAHRQLSRTAAYSAVCWAAAETDAEVRSAMAWHRNKALTHQYQWNEVGSAHYDYSYELTLGMVLDARAAVLAG